MSTRTQGKFMDLKGRKIQMSDRGAYFVRTSGGKKLYGVKAAFESVAGQPVKITRATAKKVPCPIRPTMRKPPSGDKAAATAFMKSMTTSSANIKKLRRLNTD